jgi:cobalt-zinc-cadmium efflux system membrane fusion protein
MNRRAVIVVVFFVWSTVVAPLPATEEHHDAEHHDAEHHDAEHADEAHAGEEHVEFDVDAFREAGVTLGTAGPGDVDLTVELPAEVRPNADRLSHLAAPFPGIVRTVNKTIGDRVRADDLLAVIESETLMTYPLKAGFDGVVIDKHVTPGEAVTRDHRLFIVADLSTVWVEIDVYLDVLPLIQTGQAVRLETAQGEMAAEGKVSYVSPIIDQATRTATARVVLANPDGHWRPGLFVTALVARPVPAPVLVPRRALHNVEGRNVVFAVEDDHFAIRTVVVGVTGRVNAAIEHGLAVGERFADQGSFLVKAELLKGEAAHEH